MSLKLLLDEDITPAVAQGLRARGVDAVSVHEVRRGNRAISDAEQLAYATAEGRVLVTYNRDDFQTLDTEWQRQGRFHAGILWCMERIIPRRAIGDVIRALQAVADSDASLTGLCLPLVRAPSAD